MEVAWSRREQWHCAGKMLTGDLHITLDFIKKRTKWSSIKWGLDFNYDFFFWSILGQKKGNYEEKKNGFLFPSTILLLFLILITIQQLSYGICYSDSTKTKQVWDYIGSTFGRAFAALYILKRGTCSVMVFPSKTSIILTNGIGSP